MTSQELESMAATVISPIVDGAYQSGCHTASVWDNKSKANIPRLMKFMNDFGLITARDPKGEYLAMTDVIHKVLNDLTVDDWAITIGVTLIQECLKVLLLVLTQELLRLH
jgi:aconitate hydratase 2/2-methylisocitrate dehydratase